MEEYMEEKMDKGFTIKDKRTFTQNGEVKETTDDTPKKEIPREDKASQSEKEEQKQSSPPPPEVNFSSFVLSLSSSALFHFGEIPDPISNQKQRNLPMAKQTIDILGMLKEKTAGNLTEQEDKLLDNLLYDLRMRYINETKKDPSKK